MVQVSSLCWFFSLVRQFLENLKNLAIGSKPEKKHNIYIHVYWLIFHRR